MRKIQAQVNSKVLQTVFIDMLWMVRVGMKGSKKIRRFLVSFYLFLILCLPLHT